MSDRLLYITGNQDKILKAQEHFQPHAIEFEAVQIDIPELRRLSLEEVAIDKVQKAYGIVQRRLIVNNSGWNIPALRGFPGPYMREMNDWLDPEDFINLMSGHSDRRIILENLICFMDSNGHRIFRDEVVGKILFEKRGQGKNSDTVVSLTPDGKSIAELHNEGIPVAAHSNAYKEFAQWYSTYLRSLKH